MEIVRIFGAAHSESALFAARYSKDVPDEFERCFDEWNDAEWLEAFCEENADDLPAAFRRPVTVAEASREIRDEAILLEQRICAYAGSIPLQKLFKPLFRHEYTLYPMQKSKASVYPFYRPKIRLYAIRMSADIFIITGGAVKLTATMNERPHLQQELRKLEMVKSWLQQNDLTVPDALNNF